MKCILCGMDQVMRVQCTDGGRHLYAAQAFDFDEELVKAAAELRREQRALHDLVVWFACIGVTDADLLLADWRGMYR